MSVETTIIVLLQIPSERASCWKYKGVTVPLNLLTDAVSLYLMFLVMFSKSSDYTKTLTGNNCDY